MQRLIAYTPTPQQYLSYNFGAMVILPIPYELGECEWDAYDYFLLYL